MALPGSNQGPQWTDRIRGSFGFFTSSGHLQIAFFTTRISLDKLRLLKTARQVLPRKSMSIRELMQRDIDDKRVREEIVRYLTPKPGQNIARFFPPLVTAILVKDSTQEDARIIERYPTPRANGTNSFPRVEDPSDRVWYEERIYETSFGFRIPLPNREASVETEAIFSGAEFCWDRDLVDLLVLDGQHRLVALQAALGTLNPEEVARGYEDSRLTPGQMEELGFNSIPVCIIFPPELHVNNQELDVNETLISVFRQVFVDVNKNAKPVSDSRNILLSERDLFSIFTRNIISSFKSEESLPTTPNTPDGEKYLPLYAFEWDSPEKKEYQINDSRAISSVGILYLLVKEILLKEGGEENFRTELGVEMGDSYLDPSVTNKPGPSTDLISPDYFSSWQREVLEERFADKWQEPIILLLRGIYPSHKLVEALEDKRINLDIQRSEEPLNVSPKYELEYLLGTKADQSKLEAVSRFNQQVGSLSPESCAQAVRSIRDQFIRRILEPLREGPFARLFFSNVGQRTLFRFVFRTLYKNLPNPDEVTPLEISQAFISDFNWAFENEPSAQSLFDVNHSWNTWTIPKLGTNSWIFDHLASLLEISVAFYPQSGFMSNFFQSSDDWDTLRTQLYQKGCDGMSDKSLKSRLPFQLKNLPEVEEIQDKARRKAKLDELVRQRAEQIVNELNDFVREHARESQTIPERLQ